LEPEPVSEIMEEKEEVEGGGEKVLVSLPQLCSVLFSGLIGLGDWPIGYPEVLARKGADLT
jgi:hypothetical protein